MLLDMLDPYEMKMNNEERRPFEPDLDELPLDKNHRRILLFCGAWLF